MEETELKKEWTKMTHVMRAWAEVIDDTKTATPIYKNVFWIADEEDPDFAGVFARIPQLDIFEAKTAFVSYK